MNKVLLGSAILGCLATVGGVLVSSPESGLPLSQRSAPIIHPSVPGRVAANGSVEGARPEVALRPEAMGIVAVIRARENARVKRGDLLLELRNGPQKARVALAQAEVAEADAALKRLRNGAREEERRAAAALESARKAVYDQVNAEWERLRPLLGTRSISQDRYDAAYYRTLRAKAEWKEALAQKELVEAPPRSEDVDAAEARLEGARARLKLAEEELAKTRLLAPSDGQVLRVTVEPGEMVAPDSDQAPMLMANLSHRRVRAFVEELDIDRIHQGQGAVVTADGFPGEEFTGRVGEVMPRMGKRAPRTDEPGEYTDMYVREVLIDLEGAECLPINLRVQVRIDTSAAE
jgi:HlyD family secretion protein